MGKHIKPPRTRRSRHQAKEQREALKEFIERRGFVWLGWPEPLPAGKRGPKPKQPKTQYDVSINKRLRTLGHKRVRLPEIGAQRRLKIGEQTRQYIAEAAKPLVSNTPKHNLASKIHRQMERQELSRRHDKKTIRRALKNPPR